MEGSPSLCKQHLPVYRPPLSPNLLPSFCYTLPKGGGAYPHGDLSRCAAFGKFRHHSVVFAGGGAAERRHSKRMAGHGRGGAGGGSLSHPAGPDGSMAAGAGVSDSHRGGHRPRCLRLAGGAVLSAAGGMVHGSPPRADGGGAPARRPQQQFQRLSAPFAGAACSSAPGACIWPCRACCGFWGGAAGRQSPPPCSWPGPRCRSGPSATPASRCRSRFRAGPWCWCGMPPPKAPCHPRWGPTYPPTFPVVPPRLRRSLRCGSSLAPPLRATASCPPPPPPSLQPRPGPSTPLSATSHPRRAAGRCWRGRK